MENYRKLRKYFIQIMLGNFFKNRRSSEFFLEFREMATFLSYVCILSYRTINHDFPQYDQLTSTDSSLITFTYSKPFFSPFFFFFVKMSKGSTRGFFVISSRFLYVFFTQHTLNPTSLSWLYRVAQKLGFLDLPNFYSFNTQNFQRNYPKNVSEILFKFFPKLAQISPESFNNVKFTQNLLKFFPKFRNHFYKLLNFI